MHVAEMYVEKGNGRFQRLNTTRSAKSAWIDAAVSEDADMQHPDNITYK